jgi:hypothetical protein
VQRGARFVCARRALLSNGERIDRRLQLVLLRKDLCAQAEQRSALLLERHAITVLLLGARIQIRGSRGQHLGLGGARGLSDEKDQETRKPINARQ